MTSQPGNDQGQALWPVRQCARCGHSAPQAIACEAGQHSHLEARGWTGFHLDGVLVVDLPWEYSFVLPAAVVDAIRSHPGPIRCDRLAAGIREAQIRDVGHEFLGLVCGDCQDQTGWSSDEWITWLALNAPISDGVAHMR